MSDEETKVEGTDAAACDCGSEKKEDCKCEGGDCKCADEATPEAPQA